MKSHYFSPLISRYQGRMPRLCEPCEATSGLAKPLKQATVAKSTGIFWINVFFCLGNEIKNKYILCRYTDID